MDWRLVINGHLWTCTPGDIAAVIGQLEHTLSTFSQRHRLDLVTSNNVSLVLEELVVNILNHGIDAASPVSIEISLTLNDADLVVTVRDNAKAFNPLKQPPPNLDLDLDERPVGGLGIHLVLALTSEAHYDWREGHNCFGFRLKPLAIDSLC